MRKFERAGEPAFLTDKWERWGAEWEQRKRENPGAQFHWRTVDGEPVNQKLMPALKSQTQDHCSFCDAFPVAPPSIDTIEHFRPKGRFPREAYLWTNLYFCCMHCQQKGEEFHEALLRPDSRDYTFDRYFRWDFTTGEMKINTLASAEDQLCAEMTIKLYRLNFGHSKLRRLVMQNRASNRENSDDLWPYRHYVE